MRKQLSLKARLSFAAGALALSLTPMALPVAWAATAPQYTETYTARLTGAQETPPVVTDDVATMVLRVREDGDAIRYRLMIDGQNITDAHLHCGAVGQAGPAVVDLFTPAHPTNMNSEVLTGRIVDDDVMEHLNDCSPGIRTLAHLAQAMREGKIYVNVHSTDYPNGEIRGQLRLMTNDIVTPPTDDQDRDTDNNPVGGADPSAGPSGAHILLSDYFVLPPNAFTIDGRRFAANEDVRITALGRTYTVRANQNGAFTLSDIAVALRQNDTSFLIQATGLTSGITESATLKVGTYYPVVTPSSWYVDRGETITFDGRRFGPNENVQIMMDGDVIGAVTSNGMGSIDADLEASSVAGSHVYTFKGMESGVTYRVGVNVSAE